MSNDEWRKNKVIVRTQIGINMCLRPIVNKVWDRNSAKNESVVQDKFLKWQLGRTGMSLVRRWI
jgi:hypothetical protein